MHKINKKGKNGSKKGMHLKISHQQPLNIHSRIKLKSVIDDVYQLH